MYPAYIVHYTIENKNTVPEGDADTSETREVFITKLSFSVLLKGRQDLSALINLGFVVVSVYSDLIQDYLANFRLALLDSLRR